MMDEIRSSGGEATRLGSLDVVVPLCSNTSLLRRTSHPDRRNRTFIQQTHPMFRCKRGKYRVPCIFRIGIVTTKFELIYSLPYGTEIILNIANNHHRSYGPNLSFEACCGLASV